MPKRKLKSDNKSKEKPPPISPDGVPVVKRGRGRPPKNHAEPPTKQCYRPETESEKSSESSSSSSSSDESEEEYAPQSAIRKRGKRCKNYVEVDSDVDMDEEEEREEGDAEISADDAENDEDYSLSKKFSEMFKARRYWGDERRQDFVIVNGPAINARRLRDRLVHRRKVEELKMTQDGLIQNHDEYRAKFETPDPYKTFRTHQNLSWQVQIKMKLDSKEKTEWSEKEIENIAMGHQLEPLQVAAYIFHQRNGPPEMKTLHHVPHKTLLAAKEYFETNQYWSQKEGEEFCRQNEGATRSWMLSYLRGARSNLERKRRYAIEKLRKEGEEEATDDEQDREGNLSRMYQSRGNFSKVSREKMDEIFKTKRYWNRERLTDFILVTKTTSKQLANRLDRARAAEKKAMLGKGIIGNKDEYKAKYCDTDSYVTLRDHQDLPWQVEIKRAMESKKKSKWSEKEIETIAMDHRLEPLQVDAYIAHQKNGAKVKLAVPSPETEEPMEVEQDEEEETISDIESNVPVVQNQSSSVNPIIEEEEVIQWNGNVFKCSDILKKRRRLPDNLRSNDPQEQEALEEAYSRCKTVNSKVLRFLFSTTTMITKDITNWFRLRRAYDFEEEGNTNAYNQKISQAWLALGYQLVEEEDLLRSIANWAKVPVNEARNQVKLLSENSPHVEVHGVSVPLRDLLEWIDVLLAKWPRSLQRSPGMDHSLEKTFVFWFFYNELVLDEQMMAETEMGMEEVMRWLQERMEVGLVEKQVEARYNNITWMKLLKLRSRFQNVNQNCIQMISKWAGCSEREVVNYYREREDEDGMEQADEQADVEMADRDFPQEVEGEEGTRKVSNVQRVSPSLNRSGNDGGDDVDVAEVGGEKEDERETDHDIEPDVQTIENQPSWSNGSREDQNEEEEEEKKVVKDIVKRLVRVAVLIGNGFFDDIESSSSDSGEEEEEEEEIDDDVQDFLEQDEETDAIHDVEPDTPEVQNQSSSVNAIPEEKEEEVIRWNGNVFKCSDILKKRRRLPDNLRSNDPQEQEDLEEAYSRCKTVNSKVLRFLFSTTTMITKDIENWFRLRRAYDFEEEVPTNSYNQKISQAWLFFDFRLVVEDGLLELVAKWAEIPIDEARNQVKLLSENFPYVDVHGVPVPLRDILEWIDVLVVKLPRSLIRSSEVNHSLVNTFFFWFFNNESVLYEHMIAESGMGIEELVRWLQERKEVGLVNKKTEARYDNIAWMKLYKLRSCLHEVSHENCIRVISKWAGCSEREVVNYYRDRADEQADVEMEARDCPQEVQRVSPSLNRSGNDGEDDADVEEERETDHDIEPDVPTIENQPSWSNGSREDPNEEEEVVRDIVHRLVRAIVIAEEEGLFNDIESWSSDSGEEEEEIADDVQLDFLEQDEDTETICDVEPNVPVNAIPVGEVIRWNEKVYKCSDILKKRRRLPDNVRHSDPRKQDVLETAYSCCKTANTNIRMFIRASIRIKETEVTKWFQRRRAYDFEDGVRYEAQNQKIFQAWLYFGYQLDKEEDLLKFIANWAKVPVHEARKEVMWLSKELPQVPLGGAWVPLRDFLEHIDVFFSIDWPESLKRSPKVEHSLEKTFINWYFHDAIVFDHAMMAESGMKEDEVMRWLDERMKHGLEKKKDAAKSDKNTRIQLIKFWSLFNELGGESSLKMVAKWASCHEQDVVKFYKEQNAASVEGVREQEDQGE